MKKLFIFSVFITICLASVSNAGAAASPKISYFQNLTDKKIQCMTAENCPKVKITKKHIDYSVIKTTGVIPPLPELDTVEQVVVDENRVCSTRSLSDCKIKISK